MKLNKMSLQGSGQISYSDIRNEFGASLNNSLANYRINDTISGSGLGNPVLDNPAESGMR